MTDAASSKAFMQLAAKFPPSHRFAANFAQQSSLARTRGAACTPGIACAAADSVCDALPIFTIRQDVSVSTSALIDLEAAPLVGSVISTIAESAPSEESTPAAVPSARHVALSPATTRESVTEHLLSLEGGLQGAGGAVAEVITDILDGVEAALLAEVEVGPDYRDMVDWEAVRVAPMAEVITACNRFISAFNLWALPFKVSL